MEGEKKKKRFTRKQLRAGQGMLTQQSKTNIYCSQQGMTCFGAVRHGKDIAVKELYEEEGDYPTDEEEEAKPVATRRGRGEHKSEEPEPEEES